MPKELKNLNIGEPAKRAFEAAGFRTLNQMCDRTEKEILALHGVGPKAVRILKEELAKEGWSLKKTTAL